MYQLMGSNLEKLIPESRESSSAFRSFCCSALNMHFLAKKLDSNFRVFSNPSHIKLLKLPDSDLTSIAKRLNIYSDVFQLAMNQKELFSSVQEKQLLWFALRTLRLAPPSELFNLVSNDHIVEVYMGSRQVYRTFNYYSLCSYSLDELETTPWDELFYRKDPNVVEKIFGDVARSLKDRCIVKSEIPAHVVVEKASALKNEFMYKLEYVAPLTDLDHNNQDCFLAVLSAQLINSPDKAEKKRRQDEYENNRFSEQQWLVDHLK